MKAESALTATCVLVVALSAGMAIAGEKLKPAMPDNLRVAPTHVLLQHSRAAGVQIYECKPAAKDRAGLEWQLKAPEADLFDQAGRRIGTHYAGPTWELVDGSKVVGEVLARDAGPDVNAIPWLLLSAKSSSGVGVLGRTVHIQRLNTVGGKAPSAACGAAEAGRELRVPYTASYLFYAAGS